MTKRKPGRPRSEDKRDAGMRVMLTRDEMSAFVALAEASKKPMSSLAREIIVEHLADVEMYTPPVPQPENPFARRIRQLLEQWSADVDERLKGVTNE